MLFVVASVVGTVGYRVVRAQRLAEKKRADEEEKARLKQFAVEHGDVATPAELHAHGNLYFTPVGRQAIPVESLAEYYRQKFGIEITVLPVVKLPASACERSRNQCAGEEVTAAMTNAYPEIARNPQSAMIAITDEDIFPREVGWDFTYSLHSARMGVVSTRRMDPGFWGDQPNEAYRLAATKQMLTKYIALQYFHLAESYDPTSNLFSPLTPDGGPDDIYKSDLHPEASANGRRGSAYTCLTFSYSYKTHELTAAEPRLADCQYHSSPNSIDDEIFEVNLGWGTFSQRSLDFRINSTPAIELKRGYNSARAGQSLAFGWGGNHSYNSWLSSDGLSSLSFININYEDGDIDYLKRVTAGQGFDPGAIYESHDYAIYGAHLTWEAGHYKLQYRNGDSAKFLPCNANTYCYWIGYQDAKGNSLKVDRGPNQELRQLKAGDNQGVDFQSDDNHRTIQATPTDGTSVAYEYDEDGCLARVHRLDGQTTLYEYDRSHRMTSVSVVSGPGAAPQTILTNEYDSAGRVVKQTLAGIGTYLIEYAEIDNDHPIRLKITTPEDEVLRIVVNGDHSVALGSNVRFPHKQL